MRTDWSTKTVLEKARLRILIKSGKTRVFQNFSILGMFVACSRSFRIVVIFTRKTTTTKKKKKKENAHLLKL